MRRSVPSPEAAAASIESRRAYQRDWQRERRAILIEQAAKAGVIVRTRPRVRVDDGQPAAAEASQPQPQRA